MHSVISVLEGGGSFLDPCSPCHHYTRPFGSGKNTPHTHTITYTSARKPAKGCDPLRLFHYFSLAPFKNTQPPTPLPQFADFSTECSYPRNFVFTSSANIIYGLHRQINRVDLLGHLFFSNCVRGHFLEGSQKR